MAEMKKMTAPKLINILLADPVYGWETEKAYIWQDDAACAFQPPTLFEIAFEGDPVADGLSANEIKDLNEDNLAAAKKICDSCPVWDQCYTSAEPEDFKYTMRAGIDPIARNRKPHGRPRKGTPNPAVGRKMAEIKLDPTKPCKAGHSIEEWRKRTGSVDSWYCLACKRENKSKNAKRTVEKAFRVDPTKPCVAGHDEWVKDYKGYWRCKGCRRSTEQARKAARMGE